MTYDLTNASLLSEAKPGFNDDGNVIGDESEIGGYGSTIVPLMQISLCPHVMKHIIDGENSY